jgi:hypothetical protein
MKNNRTKTTTTTTTTMSSSSLWTLLWIGLFILPPTATAMTASPHPFIVHQFNESIPLKIKGDEFDNWITDEDGKCRRNAC